MNNDQANSGGILQTPEFLMFKEERALARIGSHLLIAALFKNGLVIGMRFDKRQNSPMQWLLPINDHLVVAGWGDAGDFGEICQFINHLRISIGNLLSDHYVSIAYLRKNIRSLLKNEYKVGLPHAVDFVFVDVLKSDLWIVNFIGQVMHPAEYQTICAETPRT